MPSNKKVSGKTHTKKQLDNYANQMNPNSKEYKANQSNKSKQRKKSKNVYDPSMSLDWYCYSNPYDFD